jgi:hypothetical protein
LPNSIVIEALHRILLPSPSDGGVVNEAGSDGLQSPEVAVASSSIVPKIRPFGVELGVALPPGFESAHRCTHADGLTGLTCDGVPQTLNGFDYYLIRKIDNRVAKVVAIGTTHQTDSHGYEVRAQFKRLHRLLSEKYSGPENDYDFLMSGSIWEDPEYFAMSLTKDERHLTSFWKVGNVTIVLKGSALDSNKTYLSLGYEHAGLTEQGSQETDATDSNAL